MAGMVGFGLVWHGEVRFGAGEAGVVRSGMVRLGLVWHGMAG